MNKLVEEEKSSRISLKNIARTADSRIKNLGILTNKFVAQSDAVRERHGVESAYLLLKSHAESSGSFRRRLIEAVREQEENSGAARMTRIAYKMLGAYSAASGNLLGDIEDAKDIHELGSAFKEFSERLAAGSTGRNSAKRFEKEMRR